MFFYINCKINKKALYELLEMKHLTKLDLEGSNFNDELAKIISSSKRIEQLEIGSSKLTSVGLQSICKMKQLKSLDIWNIDASDKPTLLVFNKVDLLEDEEDLSVKEKIKNLKNTYWNKEQNDVVFISAANKENIEELRKKLRKLVETKHFTIFPNYLKNTYY